MTDSTRQMEAARNAIENELLRHSQGFPTEYILNDLRQRKKIPHRISRTVLDQMVAEKIVNRNKKGFVCIRN